jgi:DNA-binding response OmpR family regulator
MEQAAVSAPARTRVGVLADDLIWASRLRAAVENAGAQSVPIRSAADIGAPFVLIDLGGRGYDGIEAVRTAASAGAVVIAVGQHDDVDVRKAALAAGAKRVLSYNKMFSDGPAVVARLIAGTL